MPSPVRSLSSLVLTLPLLASACGSGAVTTDQACTDSATAACAKLDQCVKNGTASGYGSVAACIQRLHDGCVLMLSADGNTGTSIATLEGCAKALPAESCQDYFANNPVAVCAPMPGSYTPGTACVFNGQCMSAFCAIDTGAACGVCENAPLAGDPCRADVGCGVNLVCTPMQTCQPWVLTGGACDDKTLVCVPGQTCVIPAKATTGNCQPLVTTAGAMCDNSKQKGTPCDPNAGLFCDSMGMCAAFTYVNAGAMCGSMNKGMAWNACSGASGCYAGKCVAFGVASTTTTGGSDGGVDAGAPTNACDNGKGPSCISPDRCIGTTCTTPDPVKCM